MKLHDMHTSSRGTLGGSASIDEHLRRFAGRSRPFAKVLSHTNHWYGMGSRGEDVLKMFGFTFVDRIAAMGISVMLMTATDDLIDPP